MQVFIRFWRDLLKMEERREASPVSDGKSFGLNTGGGGKENHKKISQCRYRVTRVGHTGRGGKGEKR